MAHNGGASQQRAPGIHFLAYTGQGDGGCPNETASVFAKQVSTPLVLRVETNAVCKVKTDAVWWVSRPSILAGLERIPF